MPQDGFATPANPQKIPGLPEDFLPLVFDGFEGLNTKPTRPAIKDQQMFYCRNWMPLGPSNLRTLPDIGAAAYTATSGHSVSFFSFGNIVDQPLGIVFESDGRVNQFNTNTGVQTSIAPAGTIVSPTQQIGLAQWGSQYILFCAPQTNGFFIWDGTLFYTAGTVGPAVNITNDGLDYTGLPSVTAVGGAGSGSTYLPTIVSAGSVSQIVVTAPGTGYTSNDVVYLAFTGGNGTQSAIATANIANGVLTSITMVTGGSFYNPTSIRVSIQGGGGEGGTGTATVTNGSVASVQITNSGAGYTTAPTVIFTDANNPVAQATVPIMPFGIQGTSIETYASRVWVANGAAPSTPPAKSLVLFSAPGSPTDFSVGDGAGAFVSTDSFLRVGFHGLRQSNGFLYLIGDSSVNYASGVQTTGNPPVTTFSNQNVDPQIGTPWPNTVQVYSRAIVFANTFGVHAMYGGAITKVSGELDGIYTSVAPTGGTPAFGSLTPSSAVAIVYGIHIYCLLLPIIDQFTQLQTNEVLCWDGTKWWQYVPSKILTQIASQEINSVLTAWGTDGHAIYPLFNQTSQAISKIVQSKQWDKPSYIMIKNANQVSGIFKSNDNNPVSLTINIDTEAESPQFTVNNVFAAQWFATGGVPANWTATGGLPVTWSATGLGIFYEGINASGALMGLTASTTATDVTLLSITINSQQHDLKV